MLEKETNNMKLLIADDNTDLHPIMQSLMDDWGYQVDIVSNGQEAFERAMAIAGMFDVVVTTPTSNVTVLENELPVPFDASGNSLVTVT